MLKVEEKIESGFVENEIRNYLGASIIGEECARRLWYKFRWYNFERIEKRQSRLFARGHREEKIILKDLKKIGVKVLSTQERKEIAQGHISGSNDGILFNVPGWKNKKVLFEGKTCNQKGYDRLMKEKCIETWNKTYFVQSQVYMHLFNLKYCLFIVVNKNDDSRFYKKIYYNKETALFYLERGVEIINSNTPPERTNEKNQGYYYCQYFCKDMNGVCYNTKEPLKTCRSCKSSRPIKKGKWECQKLGIKLNKEKQLKSCERYKKIEN